MLNRAWLERLAEILAAHPGKPVVVVTTKKGDPVTIRDVRTEDDSIRVVIQTLD